jgi:hypothetical protein
MGNHSFAFTANWQGAICISMVVQTSRGAVCIANCAPGVSVGAAGSLSQILDGNPSLGAEAILHFDK